LLDCNAVFKDAWSKFEEEQLPPKEHFYSSLNDDACKDVDYEHAQTVWNEFQCVNMGDYHNLYRVRKKFCPLFSILNKYVVPSLFYANFF
jgi:hypothetical protein